MPISLHTDEVPAYDLPTLAAKSANEVTASTVRTTMPSMILTGDGSLTAGILTPEDDRARPGRAGGATPAEENVAAAERLLKMLASPAHCSRRFAYRQFDSTVQGNTVFGPGQAAAAVIRVEGTTAGLAMTT